LNAATSDDRAANASLVANPASPPDAAVSRPPLLEPKSMTTWRRKAVDAANNVLAGMGIRLISTDEYRRMLAVYHGPTWDSPPVGAEERAYLTLDNPRLADLRRRYQGHPAATHTQWSDTNLLRQLVLTEFRGENHYVYQVRYSPTPETYMLTAQYVRDNDALGLFDSLSEDGMFGAYTLPHEGGRLISRDLLASINEINVIHRTLAPRPDAPFRVLDIGAGYGRLAHRMTTGLSNAHVTCADAVPISTFLSEFYLRFRGLADRTRVIALDELADNVRGQTFDLVTNIHSFSECQASVIGWWLDLLTEVDVKRMMIIPNARDQFLSTEVDGTHPDYAHLLSDRGWRLVHKEPIYARSDVAERYALYPNFCFHWFER